MIKNAGLRALLIQKSIKLADGKSIPIVTFESFVNSEEYQTFPTLPVYGSMFESFVNSEEYQTYPSKLP